MARVLLLRAVAIRVGGWILADRAEELQARTKHACRPGFGGRRRSARHDERRIHFQEPLPTVECIPTVGGSTRSLFIRNGGS